MQHAVHHFFHPLAHRHQTVHHILIRHFRLRFKHFLHPFLGDLLLHLFLQQLPFQYFYPLLIVQKVQIRRVQLVFLAFLEWLLFRVVVDPLHEPLQFEFPLLYLFLLFVDFFEGLLELFIFFFQESVLRIPCLHVDHARCEFLLFGIHSCLQVRDHFLKY